MTLNIALRPEMKEFIEAKVRAGEYASSQEVVEAGLARLMDDDLDDETLAAIEEGEAQLDRGEGIPLDVAFARLREKHLPRT